jgi:3-methyladenine DNA glycosylase AlkD
MKSYHQELRSRLDRLPKASLKDRLAMARYIGGVHHEKRKPDEQSQLVYLGIGLLSRREVPELSFSKYPKEKQALIWGYIWKNSNIFEEKSLALDFFNQKALLKEIPKYWPIIKTWVQDVDNWAHSDGLSALYTQVLESDHKKYLPFFKKLNKAKNPWERRQSIVGLYYYARLRKKTLPAKVSLELVKNLIDDKHIYVQKGVGWTLREIYQVDEKAQLDFVRKHIKKIAPAGYYATVEKYPLKLKQEIKQLRTKK